MSKNKMNGRLIFRLDSNDSADGSGVEGGVWGGHGCKKAGSASAWSGMLEVCVADARVGNQGERPLGQEYVRGVKRMQGQEIKK